MRCLRPENVVGTHILLIADGAAAIEGFQRQAVQLVVLILGSQAAGVEFDLQVAGIVVVEIDGAAVGAGFIVEVAEGVPIWRLQVMRPIARTV